MEKDVYHCDPRKRQFKTTLGLNRHLKSCKGLTSAEPYINGSSIEVTNTLLFFFINNGQIKQSPRKWSKC